MTAIFHIFSTTESMSRDSSLPLLKIYTVEDPPLNTEPEPFIEIGKYDVSRPIAIDFGSYNVRAGYTGLSDPNLIFPTRLTRHRDRKVGKTFTFIGNDTRLDQTLRSQSKTPFDGSIITNWDYVEDIMEYTFHHLGVKPNNGVQNPLIINERLACLQSQRQNWYQILFETFNLPKVAFGIDSLFSFYYNTQANNKSNGIVINCSHEETDIIPIMEGQPILAECKRINWGGRHSVDFLNDILTLKYPYFPSKLSSFQYEYMYHNFCYTSGNYSKELENLLSLDVLEDKNIVIEVPFTEILQPKKSEEELKRQAEKRKETGKRLQEQAKQRRMERLVQKTEEYEYFSHVREQLVGQSKKAVLSVLQNAGFDDEADFKKYMYNLEKSLKRAQLLEADEHDDDNNNDDGDDDNNQNKFDLIDIPDNELTEDQIKEKRKQRFLKASYDARQKAKEEKARIAKLEEEARIKDQEWRETNLNSWIKDKRNKLNALIKKRKEKLKLRDEMKDRKSQVAQKRMQNLANLAEDSPRSKRNRHQASIDNDPNDTFGANDEDWDVYNDITQNPEAFDELLEEEYKEIVELEGKLLEYDPNFTEEDTLDAQFDWRNSVYHLFLRGPRPHDSEDPHQQHQMHLNVERIRVPEILFEPTIGGQDQAGIAELCETMVTKKFGSKPSKLSEAALQMCANVWLTGGNCQIPNLRQRIVNEFTSFLPSDTPIGVHISKNPSLDSWRGMSKFAGDEELLKKAMITKEEYEEYGPDYIKEHRLGNCKYFE